MSPVWALGLLWLQGALAQGLSVSSPLKVAHCRANCILTFLSNETSGSSCSHNANCTTCWDQCEMLGSGWGIDTCDHPTVCNCWDQCEMLGSGWGIDTCDHPTVCNSAGCLQACRFHQQLEVQRSPVLVTRGEEVILVTGQTATWPPPAALPHTPHVFVLMCRQPDNTWTQVVQTLSLSARVPGPLACGTVRVMVVGVEGLVTVYSPSPRTMEEADLILRSVGLAGPQVNDASDDPLTKESKQMGTGGWNLREVSLIHQGVLVIAEVAWEAQPTVTVKPAVYLVTWELQGGGLRGNLLTDTTCVTLSLWPDTVYRIQVQVVRDPRRLSRPLVLDTRQAPLPPPSAPVLGHPGFEAVAGAASALLVFLGLLLVLSRRRIPPHDKTPSAEGELLASDHFKLFPPPVTLLLEPHSLSMCSPVAGDYSPPGASRSSEVVA